MTEYLTETLKWGADYLIASHKSDNEFIAQIGDPGVEKDIWESPENLFVARPSFRVDSNNPGTEVVAETAAALAASSIWFASVGEADLSLDCITHARTLFNFANSSRGEFKKQKPLKINNLMGLNQKSISNSLLFHLIGRYTKSIPSAAGYYSSWNGYNDELVWAASWIAKVLFIIKLYPISKFTCQS